MFLLSTQLQSANWDTFHRSEIFPEKRISFLSHVSPIFIFFEMINRVLAMRQIVLSSFVFAFLTVISVVRRCNTRFCGQYLAQDGH